MIMTFILFCVAAVEGCQRTFAMQKVIWTALAGLVTIPHNSPLLKRGENILQIDLGSPEVQRERC